MPPKKPQPSRPPAVQDAELDMAAALGRSTMESLQKVFERLDRNNDGKIDKEELMQQFEDLGYRPRKTTDYGNSEVEDVSWEVDEDCDGLIDWDNFVLMYYRCRMDKTGCEPKRLFTLAEFMIYDKDGSGTVNEDECMEMMYARFGKENVERMTEDLFKHDADGDRNISYQE